MLGHFSLSLGMRIERFVVLSAMGGDGPSISLVTVNFNRLESSTSQISVFKKLDDKAIEASVVDENLLLSGK